MEATILKAGKAAGAPVVDMVNFLRGGVVSGHVIASGDRHDHDATGLEKFENVNSPERYTGTNIHESQQALKLARRYPHCWSTAGVHPHDSSQWSSASEDAIIALANQPEVVAIGECRLDFNRNFSTPQEQERAFQAQLQIAAELQMPIFMHCRDAHELRELLPFILAEKLLIETDAPYLLPRDLTPKPTSRRNEPAYLPHILERIALWRGESAMVSGDDRCQRQNLI
ncbi:DNase TatD [Salmonella enterica subsp. enterica serovar Sanjuan]|uniref:DNase TatD n=1 Tax=Salmonella enterica subsp. enterica serovar Sanjuan TaxID=1160765 RepID=A0A447P2X6_SALET|nr:DNase TatD [Salmonella enterica subsp. enterica serovar Sanjuan]